MIRKSVFNISSFFLLDCLLIIVKVELTFVEVGHGIRESWLGEKLYLLLRVIRSLQYQMRRISGTSLHLLLPSPSWLLSIMNIGVSIRKLICIEYICLLQLILPLLIDLLVKLHGPLFLIFQYFLASITIQIWILSGIANLVLLGLD